MKIGLLVSGGLGYTIISLVKKKHDVVFVMTDSGSTSIIDYCEENSMALFVGNPRNGRAQHFIRDKDIDVLVSVNYLFIIENDLIELPKRVAFNVHGSLLPKYRGRTPHVWAIINNETETGITAHLIDDGCDTGDIIRQIKVPIEKEDTGASVLEKFAALYPTIVDDVLSDISSNNIKTYKQDETRATFFGKRTPGDGEIDWNWCKERIYNWVRAQASPYPGAYTFYDNKKLIIDQVKFDDFGFTQNVPNGTVITTVPFRIKTPNGVLQVTNMRPHDITLIPNTVLKSRV
jgi:methionyl-tRNA formyltransferase